jgi:hypothetical protein
VEGQAQPPQAAPDESPVVSATQTADFRAHLVYRVDGSPHLRSDRPRLARSILNSLSTIEIVVLGVGGMVLLTVAGVLLARRLFPRLTDSEFEPVADSLRVVYELIFALILAFVIAAVLDEMGSAESAVASEATTIGELVRANDAFPENIREDLDWAVHLYVRAVAKDEWETMKDGDPSPRATAALEGMHAEYRLVEPAGTAQTEAYSQALDDLHEVGSKRRERLDIAAADLPTMLRVLVVVGLVLLLVLEYRPHLSPVAGLVFMGTLAFVVTSAFLLTVILDYPFAGKVSVSNAPLKQDNLARFWSDELAYRPKPGDDPQPLTAQRLEGVYNSDAYGTLILRCYDEGPDHAVKKKCGPRDRGMRGVYRYYDGTLTGKVVGGVFRGWWTQAPTHRKYYDAGQVELRLVNTSDGPLIAGSWSYLYEPLEPGWDLEEIGGATPPDLARRLEDPSTFIEDPRAQVG